MVEERLVPEVQRVFVEQQCPKGHYCTANKAEPCPAGTYNPDVDKFTGGACKPCPYYSTSLLASAALSDCKCTAGYFANTSSGLIEHPPDNNHTADESDCKRCMIGADCNDNWLTLQTLPLTRGYWRVGSASWDVRRCPDANSADSSCVGGGAGTQCKK